MQVVESDVIEEAGDIQLRAVMTDRIAAGDEHPVSTVASHVGERHWLIVKQQVRDRPRHPQWLSRISG
jgi:hypothetical protein